MMAPALKTLCIGGSPGSLFHVGGCEE